MQRRARSEVHPRDERWASLRRRQRSHRVPGRQRRGLLLHHVQNVSGQELLVYHNLIDKLREPIICHDQVAYRDTKQEHSESGASSGAGEFGELESNRAHASKQHTHTHTQKEFSQRWSSAGHTSVFLSSYRSKPGSLARNFRLSLAKWLLFRA